MGQNVSDINVSIIDVGVSPDTFWFSLFQLRLPELWQVVVFLTTVIVIMKGPGRYLITSIEYWRREESKHCSIVYLKAS
jgi:hypothetical protein